VIKRLSVALILALCVLSASYAEIKLKDVGGGKVEITFLYMDSSSEMGVIGSFDNWTVPGEAMTKNGDGVWEKTISALATDEIAYKFYSKGSWILDEQAPDKKDDGFGGFNGLIIVADILSGVTPQKPLPASAKTEAGSAPAGKVIGSKLNFGMYTILGSKTTFSTQGVVDKTQKGLETDSTGLYAKSYWKIGGTLVPNVTVWFEMKAFEGTQNVWAQDSTGKLIPDAYSGFSNLAVGLLTNPIVYMNGGSTPVLNSVKTGLDTPIVVWETGYGYAKPSKRTALLWETLGERDGSNGYMKFDLGSDLKKIGDMTIEANLTPNVLTGNYGFFGWFDASFNGVKVDFQYDAKSAESSKLAKVFDKLYHQDFIFGAKTKLGDVDLTAQALVNQFSESPFELTKNGAAEIKASWALPGDALGITAGYRYTGSMAELIYGTNADALGDKGKQRALLNVFGKPVASFKLGADTSATLTTDLIDKNGVELYGKPYLEYDLKASLGKASSLNLYTKLKYNLQADYKYDSSRGAFQFGEAGAKFYLADPIKGTINGMDVYYGYNDSDKSKTLHSLIANLNLPMDATAQIGFGYRAPHDFLSDTDKKENNSLAFTLGGSIKINEPAIKTPLFYAAFVYNMDPYDDGSNNLKWSDYVPDGGQSKGDGKAVLRILTKWDF